MKVLRKMTKHGFYHIFEIKHFWSKHFRVFSDQKSKQIVKKLQGTQILSTTICSIFDPPCSQKWVLNIVTIMRRNMNLFKRPWRNKTIFWPSKQHHYKQTYVKTDAKKLTKHSSVLVLRSVRFFLHQSLLNATQLSFILNHKHHQKLICSTKVLNT